MQNINKNNVDIDLENYGNGKNAYTRIVARGVILDGDKVLLI